MCIKHLSHTGTSLNHSFLIVQEQGCYCFLLLEHGRCAPLAAPLQSSYNSVFLCKICLLMTYYFRFLYIYTCASLLLQYSGSPVVMGSIPHMGEFIILFLIWQHIMQFINTISRAEIVECYLNTIYVHIYCLSNRLYVEHCFFSFNFFLIDRFQ